MKIFFFAAPLETTTKAADVLKLIEDFFEEEKLDWDKLGSVCTDGAPSMLDARSGFLELVKRKILMLLARTVSFIEKHWPRERCPCHSSKHWILHLKSSTT